MRVNEIIQSAVQARRMGVSTVPVVLPSKRPPKGLTWTDRQTTLPDEGTIRQELAGGNGNLGFAVIGGKVSGNLEILDFDLSGEFYSAWVGLVEDEVPGLINRLAIQETMSGGLHVLYRCRQPIPGNTKIARKKIGVSGPGEQEHQGKKYKAQQQGDRWFIFPCSIETRGQGGYAVVSPSPGYNIIQPGERGEFFNFPVIKAAEREALIRCARALDEKPPRPAKGTKEQSGGKPGEDFNTRGNVLDLLLEHGWKQAGQTGERLHLTRPGKARGVSATLYDNKFMHVFSTNALPFEADHSYSPFAVYTMLEHSGDFRAAAKALAAQGCGDSRKQPEVTSRPKQSPRSVTMSELCAKEFQPIQWLLPDIFPIGSILFVGPPKLGKSVFKLNLGVTQK